MIESTLIGLGLLLTPFIISEQSGNRTPKLVIAVVIATILSLHVIFTKGFKPFKDKWLLAFAAFLLVSCFFSLPIGPGIFSQPMMNPVLLWTMVVAFSFLVMIVAVHSLEFSKKSLRILLSIMSFCGLVTSLYVICQRFGIEQFFVRDVSSVSTGGFIGNPCTVSAFVVVIIPIAISLKKYWQAAVMSIAVFLTWRHMSIATMLVAFWLMFSFKSKRSFLISLIVIFVAVVALLVCLHSEKLGLQTRAMFSSSGRMSAWSLAVGDLVKGGKIEKGNLELTVTPQPITGYGPGAFSWVNDKMNKNSFVQAHNEYVETLYDTGIIGLFLFLMSIFYLIKFNFSVGFDEIRLGLFVSFVSSCLLAGGIFIWHIGVTMFYGAFVVGLLHKEKITND